MMSTHIRRVRGYLRELERGFRRWRRRHRAHAAAVAGPPAPLPAILTERVSRPAPETLAPRVLIIAETSIPQCTKYRVRQRQEACERLGVDCTWLSWTDPAACRDALQTHSLAIFYRVPAYESVLGLIAEARRLRVPSYWESDDLVFDPETIATSRLFSTLDQATRESLVRGAEIYRQAMLACDAAIASTPGLADEMRRAGVAEVHVVENGLDGETLSIADRLGAERRRPAADGTVRIVYGSGTNTHDIDFQQAAPAIVRVLDRFPQARFRLIGPVALPEALERLSDRVERLPLADYETYLGLLAECDISIAPLEKEVFNECKSNIKYLEAAALGIPSVCSPRAAFAGAIEHGRNGFLCETDDAWEEALSSLVADAELRQRVGQAARAHVRDRYAPAPAARRQVAPLLRGHQRADAPLRILSVNTFYAPRSFGGATIVAENVNALLAKEHGFDVHVFTSLPVVVTPPYTLYRYDVDGVDTLAIGLPDNIHETTAGFDNPEVLRSFGAVLAAVKPDVVHFHCLQGLGVGMLDLCRQMDVPYAVTLHDAWWLCSRQFMIDRDGRYCDQKKIDHDVCSSCIQSRSFHTWRSGRAREALAGAAMLLTPSRFFADFHIANGFPGVRVNRNGITPPANPRRFRRQGPVRFGYVGGNTKIKGIHLVRKVFSELGDAPATLVMVDNTMNLGFSSIGAHETRGIKNVEVVPAYKHDTIDEFFAGIDVLLFPTQWKESFGLTVREALARNVWVITTDAGGVVEDIQPDVNGTIIPFLDTGAALKQAVLDAIDRYGRIEPGEPVDLGATGIRFWDEQAAELAGMLQECAGGGRGTITLRKCG